MYRFLYAGSNRLMALIGGQVKVQRRIQNACIQVTFQRLYSDNNETAGGWMEKYAGFLFVIS
jgi:hypothetical protein